MTITKFTASGTAMVIAAVAGAVNAGVIVITGATEKGGAIRPFFVGSWDRGRGRKGGGARVGGFSVLRDFVKIAPVTLLIKRLL